MACRGRTSTATPQAVKVDDTIYVSGQLSHDAEGNLVGAAPPDMETRMRQTLRERKKSPVRKEAYS